MVLNVIRRWRRIKIIEWLRNKIIGKQEITLSTKNIEHFLNHQEIQRLNLERFYIQVAIHLIANIISKCEFRTFLNSKEVFDKEYYLWNIEPNKNQNSTQFIQEIILNLLYHNECLVVERAGQLIIADSFLREEFAVKEDIFRQVSKKGMTFTSDFKMSQVLYFQLSNLNIRHLLNELCHGYYELIQEAIEKFEKSTGEHGILRVDAIKIGNQEHETGQTFDEVMEEMLNHHFRNFFKAKNAVLPIYEGMNYERLPTESSKKSTSEVKDIIDLTDEVIHKVAHAFHIPVGILKGDIANVEEITKNFLTFCIDPICNMLSEEINRKRNGEDVLQGTYLTVDTTKVMHKDIFDLAEKADKLLADGFYNVDEIRRKVGDCALNTEHSKRYYITKNYQRIGGQEKTE